MGVSVVGYRIKMNMSNCRYCFYWDQKSAFSPTRMMQQTTGT